MREQKTVQIVHRRGIRIAVATIADLQHTHQHYSSVFFVRCLSLAVHPLPHHHPRHSYHDMANTYSDGNIIQKREPAEFNTQENAQPPHRAMRRCRARKYQPEESDEFAPVRSKLVSDTLPYEKSSSESTSKPQRSSLFRLPSISASDVLPDALTPGQSIEEQERKTASSKKVADKIERLKKALSEGNVLRTCRTMSRRERG